MENPPAGDRGAMTQQAGGQFVNLDSTPTSTDIAVSDALWSVFMRGWSEGLRCGWDDGYAAGVRDEAAAYVAEWAALREDMDRRAGDHRLRERRGGDPHAVASERARRGWTP